MSKLVIENKGKPATTSRIVAKEFNIQHRDLLPTITNLIDGIDDVEFTLRIINSNN